MDPRKIDFQSLPWNTRTPGARFKECVRDGRRVRILELTREFVETGWCEKSHVGIVLDGEIEIDCRGPCVRYAAGEGIFIVAGPAGAHKARAITSTVRLFLLEDA